MRADGTLPPARADAGVGGIGSPPDRPAQPAAGAELPSGGAADRGQRSTSGAANCGASSSSPQSPIGTPAGDAESRRLASHPSAQATAGGGAQCELSGGGGFPPLLKTSACESGEVASALPSAIRSRIEPATASPGPPGLAGAARESGPEGLPTRPDTGAVQEQEGQRYQLVAYELPRLHARVRRLEQRLVEASEDTRAAAATCADAPEAMRRLREAEPPVPSEEWARFGRAYAEAAADHDSRREYAAAVRLELDEARRSLAEAEAIFFTSYPVHPPHRTSLATA